MRFACGWERAPTTSQALAKDEVRKRAYLRHVVGPLRNSISVSVDGFIADREGAFGWSVPDDEQFAFHIVQTRELGGFLCGRRLYETMLVWEADPSLRGNEAEAEFADVWCAIPKVVFSGTLDSVQGTARLAEASVAEEAAAPLDATDRVFSGQSRIVRGAR